jgi:hypothetical protein
MAKIDRFENVITWQKARQLAKAIYEVTRRGAFARDFGLSGQIQRAAVSVMSNITERFERNRRAEFHQFLSTKHPALRCVHSSMWHLMSAIWIRPTLTD